MAKVRGQPPEHFLHWKQAERGASPAKRAGKVKEGSIIGAATVGMPYYNLIRDYAATLATVVIKRFKRWLVAAFFWA
jgi:hypothetical protein